MAMNTEFQAMKTEIENAVTDSLVNTYGIDAIKSVVLRKRMLVIKTNIVKTPAVVKLFNNHVENKFGKMLRDNQLDFKVTFSALGVSRVEIIKAANNKYGIYLNNKINQF